MTQTFDDRLAALRPRLYRYCARMTGSVFDGEDVVQETLLKAHLARDRAEILQFEAWAFRIAHNASLDFLRQAGRRRLLPLPEDLAAPEPGEVTEGFRAFLVLPEAQRAAVILKDVLGHSLQEVAGILACSPAAAKSALQRGRVGLRRRAPPPALPDPEARARLAAYVRHFQAGDFDALRALLAEEVRLDLVNRLRLEGKSAISPYFTRYAEAPHWRFAEALVEGRPAMLVLDGARPSHLVWIDWQGERVTAIRDTLFAPWMLEAILPA